MAEPYPFKPVVVEPRSSPVADMVAALFSSKKFIASIAAAIAVVVIRLAGKLGWVLDADTAREVANNLTAVVVAYVVGQGVADSGKEAAIVTADAKADAVVEAAAVKAEEVGK